MKKNKNAKDKLITEYIIIIVSIIILSTVVWMFTKNYAVFIALGVLAALASLLFIDSRISRSKFIKEQNILKERFDSIKNQEMKTGFEECYILAYEGELDSLLLSAFKKNKVEDIRSITTDVDDINSVSVCCQYNSFEIDLRIYDDHIDYRIFPPSRFDIIKSTKSFIEKRTAKISSKEYYGIESFLSQLSALMSNITVIVDKFISSNKVDNVFNGRLLHKFDYYWSNAKVDSIAGIIAGPFLFVMIACSFVFGFLHDKDYPAENPIGFWLASIFVALFMVLSVYIFVLGIVELSRKHKFDKDFEERKYCKISGKPTKIKINVEITKYNMYIKSIFLYFGKTKLFLPLVPKRIDNLKNVKKCKAECMKIHANIKYLETSKIIFDGAQGYINLINKNSR